MQWTTFRAISDLWSGPGFSIVQYLYLSIHIYIYISISISRYISICTESYMENEHNIVVLRAVGL